MRFYTFKHSLNIIYKYYIMLSNILIAPSLNSLFFTGMLLIIIFILVITNFKELMKYRLYEKITILSLIIIAIGTHGLIHLGVEQQYGFNPYKWF
jgi:hypothetical protein